MKNVISFHEARARLARAEQLNRAYKLGDEAKKNGFCFEQHWAFFIAEYGIDKEAQEQFVSGYNAS